MSHDHFRPLLRENFVQMGATDLVFVDADPTWMYDAKRGSPDDPDSSFARARAAIPAAAARIKAAPTPAVPEL